MLDPTMPGRSLDAQFDALWARFSRLTRTTDTLNRWPQRWRRWLTPVNVSFIVPISDSAVRAYLSDVQRALAPYMAYAPQPTEKLHITLYQIGYLRGRLPLAESWTRLELEYIAEQARRLFSELPPFTVKIGPINAFPNAAIAEVRDGGRLRFLEQAAVSVLPKTRRQKPIYPLIPHITLGFFGDHPTAPILDALRPLRDLPVLPLTIDRAALTLYSQPIGAYRNRSILKHSVEEVFATLPLNRKQS